MLVLRTSNVGNLRDETFCLGCLNYKCVCGSPQNFLPCSCHHHLTTIQWPCTSYQVSAIKRNQFLPLCILNVVDYQEMSAKNSLELQAAVTSQVIQSVPTGGLCHPACHAYKHKKYNVHRLPDLLRPCRGIFRHTFLQVLHLEACPANTYAGTWLSWSVTWLLSDCRCCH